MSSPQKNLVECSVDEHNIAELRMVDRSGKNIFSDRLIDQLISNLDRLEAKVRPAVVILRGLPDVFSGGADKQTLLDLTQGKIHVKDLLISERLVGASFPIIAAIEGHAIGGGLVMAACADIVVAALESRYGAVFMSMGFTPGMGCTLLLEELVGAGIAREMMYTGRRFRGRELAERGVPINHIVPKEQVMTVARDVARRISEKNIRSIYLLKYALSAQKKKRLVDARVQEDFMHQISFAFPETASTIEQAYGE